MKLNDIRTVSINRILYHQKDGRIDINSSEYKAIEELVLNKYFPSFLHELRTYISDKEQLEVINGKQEQQIVVLENKLEELEAKVNELEKSCQETAPYMNWLWEKFSSKSPSSLESFFTIP